MISERAYSIALRRLRKFGVPDPRDWLHDAIVHLYESRPTINDATHLANWLSVVAWRRFDDTRKSLASRSTIRLGEWEQELTGKQCGTDHGSRLVELEQRLPLHLREDLQHWVRGLNGKQSGAARGLATNSVSHRRKRIKHHAQAVA